MGALQREQGGHELSESVGLVSGLSLTLHSCPVIRTFANEEKGKIVSIAVRPGKVDTAVGFISCFRSTSFPAHESVDAKRNPR